MTRVTAVPARDEKGAASGLVRCNRRGFRGGRRDRAVDCRLPSNPRRPWGHPVGAGHLEARSGERLTAAATADAAGTAAANKKSQVPKQSASERGLAVVAAAERFTAVRPFRPRGRVTAPRWHPAARATA